MDTMFAELSRCIVHPGRRIATLRREARDRAPTEPETKDEMMRTNSMWKLAVVIGFGCAVSACFSDAGDHGSSISLAISIANERCGIVTADALVTASDMEPMSAPLEVTRDAIIGLIEGVPAGSAREVWVRAYNAVSYVVYEGSTVVDIMANETTSLVLTLRRNFDICPA